MDPREERIEQAYSTFTNVKQETTRPTNPKQDTDHIHLLSPKDRVCRECQQAFPCLPTRYVWVDEQGHYLPALERFHEQRETAPSGGQKGRKLARFALLPWDAVWAVAEHFGRGAAKYEDRNWERGYPYSWTVDALHRHLAAWWQGEDVDEETGSSHVAAVAWHALVLLAFVIRKSGTDDRPYRKQAV